MSAKALSVLQDMDKWLLNRSVEVSMALPTFVSYIIDAEPRVREEAYGVAIRFLRRGCTVIDVNLDTGRFLQDVFGSAGAGVQQSALRVLRTLDGWNGFLLSPNFDTVQLEDYADENFGSVVYSFGTLLLRSWMYIGGDVAIDTLRTLLVKAVQIPHLVGHALLVVEEFIVDFLGIESDQVPLFLLENEVGVPRIVGGDAYLSLPLSTVLPLMQPYARTSDAPSAWTPWGRWAVFELMRDTRIDGEETRDIGNTFRTLDVIMLHGALRLRNCKTRESKAMWNTFLELIGEHLVKNGSTTALRGAALSPRCIYRVLQKDKDITPKLSTSIGFADYGMGIRDVPSVVCQGLILRVFSISDVWPIACRWNAIPHWNVADKCIYNGKESTIKSVHPLKIRGDLEVQNVKDLRLDRGHLTPAAELAFLLCISLRDDATSVESIELEDMIPSMAKPLKGESANPSLQAVLLNHELRSTHEPEHDITISAAPPLMVVLSYRRRQRTIALFLSIANCADDTLEVGLTINLQRWKWISEPPANLWSSVNIGGRSPKRLFLGDAMPSPENLRNMDAQHSIWSEWLESPLVLVKISYNLEDAWNDDMDDQITLTLPVEIPPQINFRPFRGFQEIPWSDTLFETRIDRRMAPIFGKQFECVGHDYHAGIFKSHIVAEHKNGEIFGPHELLARLSQ